MPEFNRDHHAMPGMAHFAGTGPKNKTCIDCAHRGFARESNGGRSYRYYGCGKYRELMGRIGPEVDSNYAACKYFEPKPKQESKLESKLLVQQPSHLTSQQT